MSAHEKPDWIRQIESDNAALEQRRLAAAVSPMARPQFEAARAMAKQNRDEKMGRE